MSKYELIETKVNENQCLLSLLKHYGLSFMHTTFVQEYPQSLLAIAAHCNFYYYLRGLLKLILGKAAAFQQNYV